MGTATGRGPGLSLAGGPEDVPHARHYARSMLLDTTLTGLADDVELVVSELVTNALLHAGAPAHLAVTVLPDRVRVEVDDPSEDQPVLAHGRVARTFTGRGLELVAALSARWGVLVLEGPAKRVWAEVTPESAAQPLPGTDELDIEALLATFPDEDEPGTAEAEFTDGPEQLYTIQVHGAPTALLAGGIDRYASLLRELTLLEAATEGSPEEAPAAALAAAVRHIERDWPHAPRAVEAQVAKAIEAGHATMTVTFTLPLAADGPYWALLEALEELERLSRTVPLLGLPMTEAEVRARRWVFEESSNAMHRAAGLPSRDPRPWTG